MQKVYCDFMENYFIIYFQSLTRCVPGVGLYFCSLDYIKSHYFVDKKPSPLESLAMGIVARSMSGAILIPITVVKTR